jgi:hypothetical protein
VPTKITTVRFCEDGGIGNGEQGKEGQGVSLSFFFSVNCLWAFAAGVVRGRVLLIQLPEKWWIQNASGNSMRIPSLPSSDLRL